MELGKSAAGNITRIENTLEKIPERLESTREYLSDLEKQLENAKEELGRPFPQAQELQEKFARLAELDSQLSIGDREESEEVSEEKQEEQEEDQENPIKEGLSEMKQTEQVNMAEVQAAEMKASVVQGLDKSADGSTQVEGQDIGS